MGFYKQNNLQVCTMKKERKNSYSIIVFFYKQFNPRESLCDAK